ncbi:MAG: tRNA lysidine(34) synthetase TilS [Gemmataceae bacterium]
MSDFLETLRSFLQKLSLQETTAIVAISGGPDSVALLRGIVALQEECRFAKIVAAHLNHQARGSESDHDQRFVQELCRSLQEICPELTCDTDAANVPERAQEIGKSFETTARETRYEWLRELAHKHSARWVATGHTADDQAETVLHRILRGTGLKGLAGIPARRELLSGAEVIRPILRATRQDVLTYLNEINQTYRVDSSNENNDFTRNRLRNELLPLLKQDYNPGIVNVLCRLADQTQTAQYELEHQAQELLNLAELPRAGNWLVFDATQFVQVSRHRLREAFRLVWKRERWPAQAMGFAEWDRVAAVAFGEMVATDLPGQIRARRNRQVVQIGPIMPDS